MKDGGWTRYRKSSPFVHKQPHVFVLDSTSDAKDWKDFYDRSKLDRTGKLEKDKVWNGFFTKIDYKKVEEMYRQIKAKGFKIQTGGIYTTNMKSPSGDGQLPVEPPQDVPKEDNSEKEDDNDSTL